MKIKAIILLILLNIVFLPKSLFAANVYFEGNNKISINEESILKVKINTKNEIINTVSGTVVIPSNISIDKIFTGNSAIVLWIDQPIAGSDNTIKFSGLTPGGFAGDRELFQIIIKGEKTSDNTIFFKDLEILKNDGSGTSVSVNSIKSQILVDNKSLEKKIDFEDNIPPENFEISISKANEINNDLPFIAFSVIDKGVGISHYEYATGMFFKPGDSVWKEKTSPIELTKSELKKRIFIKAIDKNNNVKIVSIAGPNYYTNILGWVIIICIFVICVSIFSKRFL